MKPIDNLNGLMEEQLRAMFDCELHLQKALVKIETNAYDPKLKEIILGYVERNEGQIMRIKQVFNLLYRQKRGEKCAAIRAMVKEANQIMERSSNAEVMDAGIITALQHIIHYQIAGYGAICNYANLLNLYEVANLMHQNLEEEKSTDKQLAMLAEEVVNRKAKEVQQHH